MQRAAAHHARFDLAQGRLDAASAWARAYQETRTAQTVAYVRDAEKTSR